MGDVEDDMKEIREAQDYADKMKDEHGSNSTEYQDAIDRITTIRNNRLFDLDN